MPSLYSPSSSPSPSSQPAKALLLLISSLPYPVSSSSGLLVVGGGGGWDSAEFWPPTTSCQPPPLPRTLDTPSLGLLGDQVDLDHSPFPYLFKGKKYFCGRLDLQQKFSAHPKFWPCKLAYIRGWMSWDLPLMSCFCPDKKAPGS